MTQIITTHLEPDILECEVKWALESITTNKAIGGYGITVELFQILKDDIMTVLHSISQQIWKTQQWPQDWERSVFIPSQRKAMPKNVQTTTQLHSSQFSSITQSSPILWPHELKQVRPPCQSPTPRIYSNSCPLSWWCHPTTSSSVVSFFANLKSFPASGSFQMSQFFASGGQTIGVSASASVIPMNI